MNPVIRALWFIEHNFARDLSLDEIATVAGVSRFHLSRAFAMATGMSVIRYVRGRRLTQAARSLADGAPDILAVALEGGYGSHEAFTRAFREQFGITPESVRAQRHLSNVSLVEAIRMDEKLDSSLQPPRFVQGKALLVAGLAERFGCNGASIPSQWQRFAPYIGNVPGQVGGAAYGVCCNSDDAGNVEYVCGVEVAEFSAVPPELVRLRLPAQKYAVFFHPEHISSIRGTCNAIFGEWLPRSGHELVDAPFFERYDERFDARTGNGGVEVWVPVR